MIDSRNNNVHKHIATQIDFSTLTTFVIALVDLIDEYCD